MGKRKERILIVDDEALNVEFLEAALNTLYQVHTSLDGFDALRQVEAEAPDLILLDVIMPGMNGFQVARTLKAEERFAAIPIIFLTIMDSFESEMEGLGAGGIDYLTKPFNLRLLKMRVHNHMELKRRSDLICEQRDLVTRQKEELEGKIARIKRLEGIISICMHCKDIRNDDASWQRIEEYLIDHSDAHFSHCICPNCHLQHYA
jgi:DNA-binding response OmpR family regulator